MGLFGVWISSARFHPDVSLRLYVFDLTDKWYFASTYRDLTANPQGNDPFSGDMLNYKTCLERGFDYSATAFALSFILYAERGLMISLQSRSPRSSAVTMTSAVAMLVATGTL